MTREDHRDYVKFADGSHDKTVGQVKTSWTFTSGERIPVTFEVLENCCSEVIIGEEILTEQNVFIEHEASIFSTETSDDDSYMLAPFDSINFWQRSYERITDKAKSTRGKGGITAQNALQLDNGHIQEQYRRVRWNYEYDFGKKATTPENDLELARKKRYENERASMFPRSDFDAAAPDGERPPSRRRTPLIPSIPTSRFRR